MIRSLPALLAVPLVFASCAPVAPSPTTAIGRFYRDALVRSSASSPKLAPVSLQGLDYKMGALAGYTEFSRTFPKPSVDTSSILVSDQDLAVPDVVEITVDPRVYGSFLDPAVVTEDFRNQIHRDTTDALETHGYLAIRLWKRGTPLPEIRVASAPRKR